MSRRQRRWRAAAPPRNQWLCHGLPTLLDGAPHLRGFRFLYDCRGETVLVVPLDFGFWRVPGSVPMGGVRFTRSWPNGSLTPLLPGFRSVDIVSFPANGLVCLTLAEFASIHSR